MRRFTEGCLRRGGSYDSRREVLSPPRRGAGGARVCSAGLMPIRRNRVSRFAENEAENEAKTEAETEGETARRPCGNRASPRGDRAS